MKQNTEILTTQEQEQLFNKINKGTLAERNEAVLAVVEQLIKVDPDSNDFKFWACKDGLFLEYGATDQKGNSYSIERSVFPIITYSVNYSYADKKSCLGGSYCENYEKMFGPMNMVFKRFESGFNRQEYEAEKALSKLSKIETMFNNVIKKIKTLGM